MKKSFLNSVLVVAAHPDDEILGCGGTLAKHVFNGDKVNILIVAEGSTSRSPQRDLKLHRNNLDNLYSEAIKASQILGVTDLKILDFPDNRLDSIDLIEITKKIEEAIKIFKPNIIYTHHFGDINIDHEITTRAVLTASRPKPNNSIKRILSFEVLSSTEWNPISPNNFFKPNWFVDITNFLDKKLEAMRAYQSEICEWPHPRSFEAIENLARYRGSQNGKKACEAFCLLRNID